MSRVSVGGSSRSQVLELLGWMQPHRAVTSEQHSLFRIVGEFGF